MSVTKGLVVSSHPSRFVLQDVSFLRQAYPTDLFLYQGKSSLPGLVSRGLRSSFSLAWFILGYATTLAALRRLSHRPLVLIAGGWDVCTISEIGYGATLDSRRRRLTRFALHRADLVLAVSEDAARAAREIEGRDVFVVYLGVDTEVFSPLGARDGSILTVATAASPVDVRRKGLRPFLELAHRFPDRPFLVVGAIADAIRRDLIKTAPENVRFVGPVTDEELVCYYRRASAYYQVSAYESFGLSVAEAMACECTPVVSDRGALPEVVGRAGQVAHFEDLTSIEEALHRALEHPTGAEARSRVKQRFNLAKRRAALLSHLVKVLR